MFLLFVTLLWAHVLLPAGTPTQDLRMQSAWDRIACEWWVGSTNSMPFNGCQLPAQDGSRNLCPARGAFNPVTHPHRMLPNGSQQEHVHRQNMCNNPRYDSVTSGGHVLDKHV